MKFAAPLLFVCTLFLVPTITHAEKIDSFLSDITLHKDSSFTVTEIIQYDFGSETRHGIFRYIPTKHPEPASAWYLERYLDIDIESVTRDGSPEPYTQDDERDRIYLKIGNANETITGLHTYTISYTVKGGLSFEQYGGAELYWNVTGNEWEVYMLSASALLRDPEGLFTSERACYRGREGDAGSCKSTTVGEDGTIFRSVELVPGEGMTIANAVIRSKVEKMVLERFPALWLWVSGLALWLLGLVYFVYRFRTRYKTGNTIIPQYEPYEGVKPMYTGVLTDGSLDPRDITAGIVYLAEQGFVKIEKIEAKVLYFFEVDDYRIRLLKPVISAPNGFLRQVLSLLFGETASVSDLVTLSSLKTNTSKQRENRIILDALKSSVKKDLVSNGFFEKGTHTMLFVAGLIVLAIVLFVSDVINLEGQFVAATIIFVSSLVIVMAIVARRRTRKGYEARDYLEGFKLFLSVTDKERMEFHNAPEKNPEQFMEYLPYAIAFGVEKKWAKVFEGITIPNPDWYDAGAGGASFSAVNLSTSLGAFSTAFASSSGSSASSGGGSSGGGGGGGGGGSW
jgi:uncharacterized membrane protein YgcG